MPDNTLYEPPFDPDDTQPTQTMSAVDVTGDTAPESGWRRLLGLVSLLGAFGFTLATVFVLLNPPQTTVEVPPDVPAVEVEATEAPTDIPPTAPPSVSLDGEVIEALPTLDPELAQILLQAPLEVEYSAIARTASIDRNVLNPFTIIPDRPRNEVWQYTVVQGDTIEAIARRFGLEPESIVWSNPRRIIQIMRPGDVLNIPPVDGVLATAIGSTRTIADYTTLYRLDDPYAVLGSPFNAHLVGLGPDSVPPSGTQIFFPDGEAETIVWRADIEVVEEGEGGSAGQARQATVVFQNGQPGSCAPQPITGGTFWTNPVPAGYRITQGYSSWHPGIDLANSPGTPIVAANGGRVIFAGWNSFGYGIMVALIHSPTMTVYGHMQSINVGCGQDVAAGQQIGLMGSTGQSSGPHLHFEIRARQGNSYVPVNPSSTIGF